MPEQLPQTKRTIAGLKKAGFKRSEFRVFTPCNSRGEYQETITYFLVGVAQRELEYIAPKIPRMLKAGLNVTKYSVNGKFITFKVEEAIKDKGVYSEHDFKHEETQSQTEPKEDPITSRMAISNPSDTLRVFNYEEVNNELIRLCWFYKAPEIELRVHMLENSKWSGEVKTSEAFYQPSSRTINMLPSNITEDPFYVLYHEFKHYLQHKEANWDKKAAFPDKYFDLDHDNRPWEIEANKFTYEESEILKRRICLKDLIKEYKGFVKSSRTPEDKKHYEIKLKAFETMINGLENQREAIK